MSYIIDSMSKLTSLSPTISIANDKLSEKVYDGRFNNIVSSAFNKISETNAQYKDVINALSQSQQFSSDPQVLIELQKYIGEYTNYVSLVSTLVRKGVSTIETLEKSQ